MATRQSSAGRPARKPREKTVVFYEATSTLPRADSVEVVYDDWNEAAADIKAALDSGCEVDIARFVMTRTEFDDRVGESSAEAKRRFRGGSKKARRAVFARERAADAEAAKLVAENKVDSYGCAYCRWTFSGTASNAKPAFVEHMRQHLPQATTT